MAHLIYPRELITILFCVIAELDKKVPTPADGQMNQMKQAQDKGIVSNNFVSLWAVWPSGRAQAPRL